MIVIIQIVAMPIFGLGLLVAMARLERAVDARDDVTDQQPYPIDPVPLPWTAVPMSRRVTPAAPGLVRSASGHRSE